MLKELNRKLLSFILLSAGISIMCSSVALSLTPQFSEQADYTGSNGIRGAYSNPNNIKLEGDVSLSKGEQIVSVSLRDSDVKQVLRMFADKAGLNVVFHSSVSGMITLDLVNVTLNDAFKMIMQMSELSYLIKNDTLMVMSAAASKTVDVAKENLTVIPVKYVDANTLAQFLNKNIFSINKPGLSNDEIVVTNPAKNELLVFGTDNDYKMAKKIVEKFDVKPQSTTYKVNHTTPREMATLICGTLFGVESPAGSAGSTLDTLPSGDESADSVGPITLGGGTIACRSVNTLKANKLESFGNNNLTVVYHPAQGAVSIHGGSVEQINMINDFISNNDRKQPQAFIEVSFVELSEEGSKEFNNDWAIISNDFNLGFDAASGMKVGPVYYKGSGPNVSSQRVNHTISYLIQNGKGRVLANPKVMVTNGKKSVINLTEDYIEKVDAQLIATSGGATNGVEKTYSIKNDMGIKLDLVPFISPDGYVSMNLKPSYSTLKSKEDDIVIDALGRPQSYLAATLLNRRNMDLSNVRIKDGETLVLGGLIKESETQKITKIPILGDVPVMGMFFRSTKKEMAKQELIIMITPRIVKDSEDVVRI